jgi:AbrB family looped-hinge helix DNA binding protein
MPKVTQKGQVTIPRDIRLILGIKTGDEVVFELDKGKAVLKKKSASIHNFKKYVGFLSHLKGTKTDDVIDALRGTDHDHSR